MLGKKPRDRKTEDKQYKSVNLSLNLHRDLNSIKKRNNMSSINEVVQTLLGLARFDAELQKLLKGN